MKKKNKYLFSNRAVFIICGVDSFEFLQSVVTADITPLKENKAVASCLLSAQGRVLFDFLLYPDTNKEFSYIIDCHISEKQELMKKLNLYKLRSKVQIKNDIILKVAYSYSKESNYFKDPRHKKLPFRYLIEEGSQNLLNEKDDTYRNARLKLCIAEGPEEIGRGEALPLDFWMDKTTQVSFKKGCFIGQEVTARVFHRNKIRRRLITLEFDERNFDYDDLKNKNFKYVTLERGYLLLLAPVNFIEEFDINKKLLEIELINNKYNFNYYR